MQHIVCKKIDDSINIEDIYNDLLKNGYSIFNVGKMTKEEFLNFSYNFGEVIPSGRGKTLVDDILIDNGTGTEKLPFHTDKSYWRIPPRFEILYVNDVKNMRFGEITVSSIIDAFNKLSSEEQKKLLNYQSKYINPSNRDSGFNPFAHFVNTIDNKVEFFRYRLDIFESNVPEINKIKKYVEENFVKIAYEKGDILILDNWKFSAGRNITVWGENGFRHLFRTLVM